MVWDSRTEAPGAYTQNVGIKNMAQVQYELQRVMRGKEVEAQTQEPGSYVIFGLGRETKVKERRGGTEGVRRVGRDQPGRRTG